MENRHGLRMDFTVSPATGTAERDAVPELLDGLRERGYRPRTLGADRGYDTKDCVRDMRARRVTPHVARKKKHSAIDGRTTRPAGYAVSLRIRRVEEVFGWMKTVGGLRHTRYRGVARTGLAGYLVATAYNVWPNRACPLPWSKRCRPFIGKSPGSKLRSINSNPGNRRNDRVYVSSSQKSVSCVPGRHDQEGSLPPSPGYREGRPVLAYMASNADETLARLSSATALIERRG